MWGGARATGGNMNGENERKVNQLIRHFVSRLEQIPIPPGINIGFLRSKTSGSQLIVLTKSTLLIVGQSHPGMTSTIYLEEFEEDINAPELVDTARIQFGFNDPFVLSFPSEFLDRDDEQRVSELDAIARTHFESEYRRMLKLSNLVQINPLFGPAAYAIDPNLVFVLMPFTPELTNIYETFVKPLVQSEEIGLVCKRADDYKTNRAIMQDIWKSICEARVVIADLTGLNPNVMYELGIAHTVGKETILIHQQQEAEIKFPFDLAHIRRIEYIDNAVGGRKLERELAETLKYVLNPKVL